MAGHKLYTEIVKKEPIIKGWSDDRKYRVTTADGTKYMLRISPAGKHEKRKALFGMLERVSRSGIPVSIPVESGVCEDGTYIIESWIEGEDAETALPMLSETEQYVMGLRSGLILREIHSIPAPDAQEEWASRFNRKIDIKLQKYREFGLRFAGDEKLIGYIEKNRCLLDGRPQGFQHGDYHIGNMMIENGDLKIIDFDRCDYGDPWEEFNRIVWSAAASPYFATGQLRGYFGGEPPSEFFDLLALYIAVNTVSSIYWAFPFGKAEVETMMKQAQNVLEWFDDMREPVPSWYLKDFYIQWADDIPVRLKARFDLSFLRSYGKVFRVIDDQGSGNICFGVAKGDDRYFIKFAGAPAIRSCVTADEAVASLKRAVPIYKELAHKNLVKLVKAEDTGGGFTVVFRWVDAIHALRILPEDHRVIRELPFEIKEKIFAEILEFHAHVSDKGYVAIDFYDGSIMWDKENRRTIICDIDFYQKSPYAGRMGLWGSSRFISPEERTDGAVIDEVTNVYTMGAAAFYLFADSVRSPEAWTLSPELFAVITRAVSDERCERQQSIRQLQDEWTAAIGTMYDL